MSEEILQENIVLESADDIRNNEVVFEDTTESISVTADASDAENYVDPKAEEEAFVIPEKLQGKSAEEIAKIYMELEKKLGKPPEDKDEDVDADAEESDEEDDSKFEGEIDESKTADSVKGFQDLWVEQGGKLSDDQWGQVKDLTGMDDEFLKKWEAFALQEIRSGMNDHDANVYEAFGGEDKYNDMIDWAEKNFDGDEIDALNEYLDNPKLYKRGVNMLKDQYTRHNGTEPSVQPKEIPNSVGEGEGSFQSEEEIHYAQLDPRYGTDPVYERQFDKKLLSYMKRTGQMPK